MITRDWRETYAGSILGGSWNILHPLLTVLMYAWVFDVVWKMKVPAANESTIPFFTFLISAMLPWLAFQDSLIRSSQAITSRADVVRHTTFPTILLPISKVASVYITSIFIMTITWGALMLKQSMNHSILNLLTLTLLISIQIFLTIGIALFLSALTPYLRDIGQLTSMAMPLLLFSSPILYPISQVPKEWQMVMYLNPFTPFAEGYHSILLSGAFPEPRIWIIATAGAVISLWIGLVTFNRLKDGFGDVL